MHIQDSFRWDEKVMVVDYWDSDDFSSLELIYCRQIYAVAFVDHRIVIVKHGKKNSWGLVGGTREKDETLEEALTRELQEEANMQVLSWVPIGYQKVPDDENSFIYQLRCCCLVKPFGPFIEDPDGHITEMKLIEPLDYRQFFDWGDIGERIITRGLELHTLLLQESTYP